MAALEKYDPIRMQDLVRVEDPDGEGGVTLVFRNGASMKVKAAPGGGIESRITE